MMSEDLQHFIHTDKESSGLISSSEHVQSCPSCHQNTFFLFFSVSCMFSSNCPLLFLHCQSLTFVMQESLWNVIHSQPILLLFPSGPTTSDITHDAVNIKIVSCRHQTRHSTIKVAFEGQFLLFTTQRPTSEVTAEDILERYSPLYHVQ
jgi:hypothetical protein